MQRDENGMIVISCDYCGADWDEIKPMIEGHRGSVLCLNCLEVALREVQQQTGQYRCAMCIREDLPESLPRWQSPARPETNLCEECLHQAARGFDRDKEVLWTWEKEG